MRAGLALLLLAVAQPALALDLTLTGGALQAEEMSPADSVRLPREPWADGRQYPEIEGAILRRVFSIPNPNVTTLQLLAPLREELIDAGYETIFSCADAACGGFDFRFQLDLLPAPAMHVDLGDFRYLLMERPGSNPHTVSLVSSSSATAAFLHITAVSDGELPDLTTENAVADVPPPPRAGVLSELLGTGHAILSDLDFSVGSSTLGPGPFASLSLLADWLGDNPGARIVLVGHTDAVGSLDANADLSRDRAESVLARLTDELGVDAAQLQAAGAGALSPVASNLTEEGRALNRRVEVVLLSLE